MYFLDKIKEEIVKVINREIGEELVKNEQIVIPPNREMGDLSLPCFELAKNQGKNPVEMAGILVSIKIKNIKSIKAVGPYLNFSIDNKVFIEELFKEIYDKGDKYGANNFGNKKKVMIEYSNANTHKEYHVGHLRNICYGDSVNKITSANGYESIPVSYINDFGINVAKTLWNYDNFIKENYQGSEKNIPNEKKGYALGKMYVDSSKRAEKDKLAKQMIGGIMKQIESRDSTEYDLWKKTRQWSIDYFDNIYKELDIHFERIYYESEVIDVGIIHNLKDKGILKESEGAVIADLEKYDLGVLVFLRSDGTATYPTADIPLAIKKIKDYNLNQSIYVVDKRQSLYFKQLFKVLELMGHKQDFLHLGYDFVKLPSGMMSSRSGNVITYDELRDEIFSKLKKETKDRHPDWDDPKVSEVVKAVGIAAIKFEMIKVDAGNIITFDIEKALKFEGYTSSYIQYTFARISSIIRKSGIDLKNDISQININIENEEHNLFLMLSRYPEIIRKAGENYDPSEVAKYLFELSQMFNDYYHKINILKAEKDIMIFRLNLIQSVSIVIKNGLNLLGIKTIKEM